MSAEGGGSHLTLTSKLTPEGLMLRTVQFRFTGGSGRTARKRGKVQNKNIRVILNYSECRHVDIKNGVLL